MDLNEVRIFVKVVQEGNFRRAAQNLGIPKSTVSRKVAELEKRLGVVLLQRSTRNVSPTEVGSQFFRRSLFSLSQLDEAEREATSAQTALVGKIRISTTLDVAVSFLGRFLADFLKENPQVEIEWVVSDRVVDLISEGFDLALRMGELEDSNLKSKKVGFVGLGLFASPAYLKKSAPLKTVADLAHHTIIRYQSGDGDDFFQKGLRGPIKNMNLSAQIVVDNLVVIRQMVVAGDGVAVLPQFMCTEELEKNRLVQLLRENTHSPGPVHLVYPNHKYQSERIKRLTTFLETRLKSVLLEG